MRNLASYLQSWSNGLIFGGRVLNKLEGNVPFMIRPTGYDDSLKE